MTLWLNSNFKLDFWNNKTTLQTSKHKKLKNILPRIILKMMVKAFNLLQHSRPRQGLTLEFEVRLIARIWRRSCFLPIPPKGILSREAQCLIVIQITNFKFFLCFFFFFLFSSFVNWIYYLWICWWKFLSGFLLISH